MQFDQMKRREFITLLGGAAAGWPFAARAQRPERMRRVGVLLPAAADDLEYQARVGALLQGLTPLGWTIGRNLQIDVRWSAGDANRLWEYAEELVALAPDVIVASSSVAVAALQKATRTLPIVFVAVVDPVGTGFVQSLAHPAGSTTGFTNFEYGLSGKWLELLKEIAPATTRAAVLRDAASPAEIAMFNVIQGAALSSGVELSPLGMNDTGEIERGISKFASGSNGGVIVLGSSLANVHRDLIILLTAQHRLAAVYPDRVFVSGGGLISYGPNRIDQFRRAAAYVDRILNGEKPSALPVQAPTTYELVINLNTAKALGLTIPPTLLARADEVIE